MTRACGVSCCAFFFFNDTATTEIYTLSLHDALPIFDHPIDPPAGAARAAGVAADAGAGAGRVAARVAAGVSAEPPDQPHRSEEHTSELQSRQYLVCRLLLEKKKTRPRSSRLCVSYLT